MEYDRRMAGMQMNIQPEMVMRLQDETETKATKPKKNKKLLLLRRGK
jgi:hypothetical protein